MHFGREKPSLKGSRTWCEKMGQKVSAFLTNFLGFERDGLKNFYAFFTKIDLRSSFCEALHI